MAHRARALPEDELSVFLRRRRKREPAPEAQPPLARFLTETLELAGRLVPARNALLYLDDPFRRGADASLTVVAALGKVDGGGVGAEHGANEGAAGRVYATGEPCVMCAGELRRTSGGMPCSMVAVPVRLERTVCGVLEMSAADDQGFDRRDRELIGLIAEHVSRAILNAIDLLKQAELARRDDLTGLFNVRGLDARLEEAVDFARETGGDVSVLFVDVDRLKRLNDRLGHRAGSEALRRIGAAIDTVCVGRGTPFRFGGDEFVVLCPDTAVDAADGLAHDLVREVSERTRGALPHGGQLPSLTVSVGVASLRTSLAHSVREATAAARLLTAADRALYRAKRTGRARTERAGPADDRLGTPEDGREV